METAWRRVLALECLTCGQIDPFYNSLEIYTVTNRDMCQTKLTVSIYNARENDRISLRGFFLLSTSTSHVSIDFLTGTGR